MTTHYFADWRDMPKKLWRWPNFSPEEIACRGDGSIRINEAALDKLQALRDCRGIDVHEVLTWIKSKAGKSDITRSRLKAFRIMFRHGNIKRRALQMHRVFGPTDLSVIGGAAIGGMHDQPQLVPQFIPATKNRCSLAIIGWRVISYCRPITPFALITRQEKKARSSLTAWMEVGLNSILPA